MSQAPNQPQGNAYNPAGGQMPMPNQYTPQNQMPQGQYQVPQPPKKPFYKKPWFIILAVIIVLGIIAAASGGSDSSSKDSGKSENTSTSEQTNDAQATEEPEKTTEPGPTASYTTEEKNCYKSAKNYLDLMGYSKQGLIEQLSSEYGDNYSKETAEKIVNDIEKAGEVDWVEEAKESARNYLDIMPFSKQELIEQLCSDAGDKYTREQAEKAVSAVYQ